MNNELMKFLAALLVASIVSCPAWAYAMAAAALVRNGNWFLGGCLMFMPVFLFGLVIYANIDS